MECFTTDNFKFPAKMSKIAFCMADCVLALSKV